MSTIDRLIAVADGYIEETGAKPTTVSLHAFGHTSKLAALRSGSDIQVRFAEAGFQWFATNWPEGKPLPAVLIEWCASHFPQGLQRQPALLVDLSAEPDAGGSV